MVDSMACCYLPLLLLAVSRDGLHVVLLLLDILLAALGHHGEDAGDVALGLAKLRGIAQLFGHRLTAQVEQMMPQPIQLGMQLFSLHISNVTNLHRTNSGIASCLRDSVPASKSRACASQTGTDTASCAPRAS